VSQEESQFENERGGLPGNPNVLVFTNALGQWMLNPNSKVRTRPPVIILYASTFIVHCFEST
jgi:hypothetical protein